jgi:hypothetical protein
MGGAVLNTFMQALIRTATNFTTFMAKAYERPELCIEFQGGWV